MKSWTIQCITIDLEAFNECNQKCRWWYWWHLVAKQTSSSNTRGWQQGRQCAKTETTMWCEEIVLTQLSKIKQTNRGTMWIQPLYSRVRQKLEKTMPIYYKKQHLVVKVIRKGREIRMSLYQIMRLRRWRVRKVGLWNESHHRLRAHATVWPKRRITTIQEIMKIRSMKIIEVERSMMKGWSKT